MQYLCSYSQVILCDNYSHVIFAVITCPLLILGVVRRIVRESEYLASEEQLTNPCTDYRG